MRDLTLKGYNKYMKLVNDRIEQTENLLKTHNYTIEVSKLSFDDWVKFQKGELKVDSEYKIQTETIWGEWNTATIISPPSGCGTILSTTKKIRVRYDNKGNSQYENI